LPHTRIHAFLPAIRTLNPIRPLTKHDLLTEPFLIDRSGDLDMYYAPHNEYINTKAKIVLIGITPGWQQMQRAFEQAVKSLSLGHSLEQVLEETKIAASFAGSIRRNLAAMLDQCGIPEALGIDCASSLFAKNRPLLHTTSVIKYPVFYKGKNYTGHQPPIQQSPLLSSYAFRTFPEELQHISPPALVIPLGKMVEHVLGQLLDGKKSPEHVVLFGFPHPSGANGHRNKQFQAHKNKLITTVKDWAEHDS